MIYCWISSKLHRENREPQLVPAEVEPEDALALAEDVPEDALGFREPAPPLVPLEAVPEDAVEPHFPMGPQILSLPSARSGATSGSRRGRS